MKENKESWLIIAIILAAVIIVIIVIVFVVIYIRNTKTEEEIIDEEEEEEEEPIEEEIPPPEEYYLSGNINGLTVYLGVYDNILQVKDAISPYRFSGNSGETLLYAGRPLYYSPTDGLVGSAGYTEGPIMIFMDPDGYFSIGTHHCDLAVFTLYLFPTVMVVKVRHEGHRFLDSPRVCGSFETSYPAYGLYYLRYTKVFHP